MQATYTTCFPENSAFVDGKFSTIIQYQDFNKFQ